jgi:hypothetical protein
MRKEYNIIKALASRLELVDLETENDARIVPKNQ